jgi:hypothetical protein
LLEKPRGCRKKAGVAEKNAPGCAAKTALEEKETMVFNAATRAFFSQTVVFFVRAAVCRKKTVVFASSTGFEEKKIGVYQAHTAVDRKKAALEQKKTALQRQNIPVLVASTAVFFSRHPPIFPHTGSCALGKPVTTTPTGLGGMGTTSTAIKSAGSAAMTPRIATVSPCLASATGHCDHGASIRCRIAAAFPENPACSRLHACQVVPRFLPIHGR